MGKKRSRSQWLCTECGVTTSGWFGKCPSCAAWNTIQEYREPKDVQRVTLAKTAAAPVSAGSELQEPPRTVTGIDEMDRVLGGGLVPGSVVLFGGPPGIGKSTLLLQAGAGLARQHGPVLYASGEESVSQISSRATRLRVREAGLLLLAETSVGAVIEAAGERDPLSAVIVDSVQTVYSDEQDGLPGNLTQIRAVTAQLISFAKSREVPVVLVGHVTKEGQLAGPRLLEHMVDAVLSFEGEDERATRLLRASKNRFGSTQELGVFEMTGDGLRQIVNPSELFLGQRAEAVVGACVTPSLEGSRPLLLEVQALLAESHGGGPRRNCVGVDPNRVAMLLAVLDRHGGMFVLDHDVFVNVAGGMRLSEPAADLAVLLAIASSHAGKPLPAKTVAFGEVGLTGELRRVPRMEERLAEAHRQGFRHAVVPATGKLPTLEGIEIIAVPTVQTALHRMLA